MTTTRTIIPGGETFDQARAINATDASKLMKGRKGKHPSHYTVRRWANPSKGCHPLGIGGPHLVLRSVRFNGELLFMASWVEEFEAKRAQLGERQPTGPVLRTSKQASRDHARAKDRIEQMKKKRTG